VRIYLAARYSRNAEMRDVRDDLVVMGHTVTSRWIDLHKGSTDYLTSEALAVLQHSFTPEFLAENPTLAFQYARADLDDLSDADACISFTCGTGGKGGRHVEFGAAWALGKALYIVGPRENVFHTLPTVRQWPDWATLKPVFPRAIS